MITINKTTFIAISSLIYKYINEEEANLNISSCGSNITFGFNVGDNYCEISVDVFNQISFSFQQNKSIYTEVDLRFIGDMLDNKFKEVNKK